MVRKNRIIICFNSRPHRGRHGKRKTGSIPIRFNSRPHRGRPEKQLQLHGIQSFQLTPSQRATSLAFILACLYLVSTHALTEGDCTAWSFTRRGNKFQLTPSQRATGDPELVEFMAECFNSRPHRGRRMIGKGNTFIEVFQLTPSQRATANLDKFFF